MASSMVLEGGFSLGIEEEYFLADLNSLAVPARTPEALFEELEAQVGDKASRESLQAQLEVRTAPSAAMAAVRDELRALRQISADVARNYGFAILASGTHPMARWRDVQPSQTARYEKVMESLRMIARRNMLCGMHVHVQLPDLHRRNDVMNRLIPYLPLFVALSTSSPFWEGGHTGLMAYRPAAYDEHPRSGLPETFGSEEEYQRYVDALIASGAIKDASFIWWLVRVSCKYPTLELRAPDVCTRLDDAIAIASLYRVLVRHLFRRPEKNYGLSAGGRALAVDNKWVAQRFGIHGTFAGTSGPQTVASFLEELIAMTEEDAAALGCAQEIEHCRVIISGGTSSDSQLRIWQERKHEGSEASLKAVSRWIAAETLAC